MLLPGPVASVVGKPGMMSSPPEGFEIGRGIFHDRGRIESVKMSEARHGHIDPHSVSP